MSTLSDPEGRPTVIDFIPPTLRKALVPVGRLDYYTEGSAPAHRRRRVRAARGPSALRQRQDLRGEGQGPPRRGRARPSAGRHLDGREEDRAGEDRIPAVARAHRRRNDDDEGGENTWWVVQLAEGRTRQIREMFRHIGHPVHKLRRVSIGPLRDPDLPLGAVRELTSKEVQSPPEARRRPGRPAPAKRSTPKPPAPGARGPAAKKAPAKRAVSGKAVAKRSRGDRGKRGSRPDDRAANPLIVAIDGPSGVGKSTAARRLARSSASPSSIPEPCIARSALKVLRSRLDPADRAAVEALAAETEVDLHRQADGRFEVLLEGEPVEPFIRAPEVGEAASAISTHTRGPRAAWSRSSRTPRGTGGRARRPRHRHPGLSDTPHKFFLDARLDVRVRRRHDELLATGRDLPYDQVLEEIQRRDHRDRTREDSPLTHDDTYTLVDTSDLVIDQVVEAMAEAVRARA